MNIRIRCVLLVIIAFVTHELNAGLKEISTFLKNAITNPKVVGAVLPSNTCVGQELVRYMRSSQKQNPSKPLRILEVGSGTGAMTEVIVKFLRPIDHLDLVEISQEFCAMLHSKYDSYSNISINCMSILDWAPTYAYDFIISTLPFNSFEYNLMDNIIKHFGMLIKQNGILSFVAYVGISQFRTVFTLGKKRIDQKKKAKRLRQWRNRYQIAEKTILNNVPPINVYHLQLS